MTAAAARNWWVRAWKWVAFWERLPIARPLDDTEREAVWDQIRAMKPDARQLFIGSLARQNDRIAQDVQSVTNRGTALLAATGVITSVLTILIPASAAIHANIKPESPLALAVLAAVALDAIVVLYCALATVLLAIRSQEVGYWSLVEMSLNSGQSALALELDHTYQLYLAYSDNDGRLTVLISYLRNAQAYFRTLAQALTVLVLVAALAIVAGAINFGGTSGAASQTGPIKSPIASAARSPHP